MRDVEPTLPGKKLPADWSVTSDSIAARIAITLSADELVLLKSASLPNAANCDIQEMSNAGYVDGFFVELANSINRVRFVNLRSID